MNIQEALQYWQEKNLLTPAKAAELRDSLRSVQHDEHRSRAIEIFSAIGAILVGLGIILFVASHWNELSHVVRVAMLLAAMIGTGGIGYWLAYERRTYEKTGLALLFVNVFTYGATIFLVAQIYHLPLAFWWGMLLWFLGTAFFAYVLQSRLHLWLAIPLFLVFVGWLMADSVGIGEFEFLGSDRVRFPALLPVLGIGMMAEAMLHDRVQAMKFGSRTLFHWGLFLVLLIIVIGTVDKHVFFYLFRYPLDPIGITALVASVAALGAALLWGKFQTREGAAGLGALALYVLFLFIMGHIPVWKGILTDNSEQAYYLYENSPVLTWLYVLHVILAFVFQLTVIWFGTLLRRPAIINFGMIGIAVTIIVQYFSWVFELLPRSFAFIIGGFIILGLGASLERQRRRILTSIQR